MTEPFGGFPPEVNAGRYIAGTGPASWVAAGQMWVAYAGIAEAFMAAFAAELANLGINWQGTAPVAAAGKAAAMMSYLVGMTVTAITNAMSCFAVATAYGAGLGTMVPLPEVELNRLNELIAEMTNFLGINSGLIAALNADYARMWGENGQTYMTYDAAVTAATSPKPVLPPPFMSSAAEGAELVAQAAAKGAANQAIGQASDAASQSLSQSTDMASQANPASAMQSMMGPMSSVMGAPSQAMSSLGQGPQAIGQLAQPLSSLMSGGMGGKNTDASAFGLTGPPSSTFNGVPLSSAAGGGVSAGGGATGLGGGLGGTMLSQGAYPGGGTSQPRSQQVFSGVAAKPGLETVSTAGPVGGGMGGGGGMAPVGHGAGTSGSKRSEQHVQAVELEIPREREAAALALFR
ncbi:PPE-repeat containing protein [Mycobacteroides abscessus subsp. abscessus]|uniref:PPE domain-containing protein n=1 Tax=Mycobacteroides abscessus TaxID=36809 RepID=UPI000927B612|nr:PPE domain-containing protein [Mycobacteroides abscessus]SIH22029.1 PPE-repeat containing protein [Mycobacteroides abscessus subsp. abscessus]